MPKTNPQIEMRDRQIDLLKKQIERMREQPADIPIRGCGDNSCIVALETGMATNGGCRCDERKLRLAVQYWRRVADYRQVSIQMLRDGQYPEPWIADYVG